MTLLTNTVVAYMKRWH